MRLFIAIELPHDQRKLLNRLPLDSPGLRRVPPEQVHLTLSFLGEVDEKSAGLLCEKLAQVPAVSFHLAFSGFGCFPDRLHPRIIWAGLQPEPRLEELAARVRTAVLACGIPLEERAFSAHITLARIKTREFAGIEEVCGRMALESVQPFPVTEFILYQSRLSAHGAQHIPVKRFPLASAEQAGQKRP